MSQQNHFGINIFKMSFVITDVDSERLVNMPTVATWLTTMVTSNVSQCYRDIKEALYQPIKHITRMANKRDVNATNKHHALHRCQQAVKI